MWFVTMGVLSSFGGLVSSIVASIVMLAFAVLSFFITVFIVQVGAGLAGYTPSGDFVVLSAAILAAGAIAAGASPLTGLGGRDSRPDTPPQRRGGPDRRLAGPRGAAVTGVPGHGDGRYRGRVPRTTVSRCSRRR